MLQLYLSNSNSTIPVCFQWPLSQFFFFFFVLLLPIYGKGKAVSLDSHSFLVLSLLPRLVPWSRESHILKPLIDLYFNDIIVAR